MGLMGLLHSKSDLNVLSLLDVDHATRRCCGDGVGGGEQNVVVVKLVLVEASEDSVWLITLP